MGENLTELLFQHSSLLLSFAKEAAAIFPLFQGPQVLVHAKEHKHGALLVWQNVPRQLIRADESVCIDQPSHSQKKVLEKAVVAECCWVFGLMEKLGPDDGE